MKRTIQIFLFALIIISIIIFAGINLKNNNEIFGDTNTEEEENILTENIDELIEAEMFSNNIVLPPGSTSVDLQNALNAATTGDIIIISSDIEFSSMVTIPSAKTLTIQSDAGNIWTLKANTMARHFYVRSGLILENIILDGRNIGGGVQTPFNDSSFIMNAGAVIQNCATSGVYNSGNFVMNDGIIRNNVASNSGGGIYSSGSFTMNGGTVTENTASSGGGIFCGSNTTINNGTINNNHSTGSGGGIYISGRRTVKMYKGTISGNTAVDNGARCI